MNKNEAAKTLVSMVADLARGGMMEEQYSEAVALACAALYQELEGNDED